MQVFEVEVVGHEDEYEIIYHDANDPTGKYGETAETVYLNGERLRLPAGRSISLNTEKDFESESDSVVSVDFDETDDGNIYYITVGGEQ